VLDPTLIANEAKALIDEESRNRTAWHTLCSSDLPSVKLLRSHSRPPQQLRSRATL